MEFNMIWTFYYFMAHNFYFRFMDEYTNWPLCLPALAYIWVNCSFALEYRLYWIIWYE